MSEPRSASTPQDNLQWLVGEFSSRLTTVVESMTGERPTVAITSQPAQPEAGLHWKQPFAGIPGEVWLVSGKTDWSCVGNQVLHAAGIEDADEPTLRSTFLETVGQALSGIGQSLAARLGHEVTPQGGSEEPKSVAGMEWTGVRIDFATESATIALGVSGSLLNALAVPPAASGNGETPAASDSTALAPALAYGKSRTFELLLDVELPVSVSFGRAQVPLKDVLKLTTGSIVELNRSIAEPVEVIANNCVIARGEVVVVEGNFGVRIQQVISKQERLRTLS